ncbi:MAG: sulfate permease [Meiothermus sp.]|uniref:SulP family inorganic anion transporter n=1 Tax=Meiothermus sp. TaxID=1955249 RepID=UPI0021DF0258|nr:SulP family inorganic anion transporter [Meiothermus sp.]GIW27802.1 MAG: sulfate permease [Meiothermus sp.]
MNPNPSVTQFFKSLELLNPVPAWRHELAEYNLQRFQQDLLAGLTVGVVALPLALAFGVTSGAGAAAGLFTAIVAGLAGSAFGGSRYNISGPTGAMTVVLLPIIAQYGVDKIFLVGIMAGLILLVLGLLRFGRLIQLIPYPVVIGFTNGIAIIIFLQQIPALLGVATPKGEHILPTTLEAFRAYLLQPQLTTLFLTALTIGLILLWNRYIKHIPGSIVALVLVTLVSLLFREVPRIGPIPSSLPAPHWPNWSFSDISLLFSPALAVALLAGIETLLSAVVADSMTIREKHDPDRELIGSSLANILAPIFGGIPATGAIARTAVNVRSGAQTRLSGIIHSVFLFLVVVSLGPLAQIIPLAALAGILMVVAVRMVEWEAVQAILRSTKSDLSIMLATMAVTVAFDLILAIEVGLALAGILFVQRMKNSLSLEPMDLAPQIPAHLDVDHDLLRERVVAFRVDGPLFFAAAGEFINSLTQVSEVDVLILRMRRVKVIDASGANALLSMKQALERRGIKFLISGLQPQPKQVLERMGLLDEITTNGHHLFETTDQAIAHAWSHVKRNQQARGV